VAGAFDLYAGSKSLTGTNLFHVDKNPLNQLFEGVDDVIGAQAKNLGGTMLLYIEQYVQRIAQELINLIMGIPSELLGIVNAELTGALEDIARYFSNILAFLGGLNPLDSLFNVLDAAKAFINNILAETGLLPILDEAGHLAQEALQPIIDAIAQAFGMLAGLTIAGLQDGLNAFYGIVNANVNFLSTVFGDVASGNIAAALEALLQSIVADAQAGSALLTQLQALVKAGFTSIAHTAITDWSTAISDASIALSQITGFASSEIESWLASGGPLPSGAVTITHTAITDWNTATSTAISNAQIAGTQLTGSVSGSLISGATTIEQGIVDGIGHASQGAQSFEQQAVTDYNSAVATVQNFVSPITSIVSVIPNLW